MATAQDFKDAAYNEATALALASIRGINACSLSIESMLLLAIVEWLVQWKTHPGTANLHLPPGWANVLREVIHVALEQWKTARMPDPRAFHAQFVDTPACEEESSDV